MQLLPYANAIEYLRHALRERVDVGAIVNAWQEMRMTPLSVPGVGHQRRIGTSMW